MVVCGSAPAKVESEMRIMKKRKQASMLVLEFLRSENSALLFLLLELIGFPNKACHNTIHSCATGWSAAADVVEVSSSASGLVNSSETCSSSLRKCDFLE